MLRINRETDYATAILSLMACGGNERFSASWLAGQRSLPAPVVSKILKQLVKSGILVSHRGAHGGYSLSRPAEDISVAEVINAIEGPIALTDCIEGGGGACQYSRHCTVSHNWSRINDVFHEALGAVSLKDMSAPLEADHPSFEVMRQRVKSAVS